MGRGLALLWGQSSPSPGGWGFDRFQQDGPWDSAHPLFCVMFFSSVPLMLLTILP